jgi:hypothetical protein
MRCIGVHDMTEINFALRSFAFPVRHNSNIHGRRGNYEAQMLEDYGTNELETLSKDNLFFIMVLIY